MVIAAKPVWGAMAYTDPKTGLLTAGGQQALAQWHSSINSIPVSVSGEQATGAGKTWTLANTPSGGALLYGLTAAGPVLLAPGNGKLWNYTLNGKTVTTEQEFQGVTASYEYLQS